MRRTEDEILKNPERRRYDLLTIEEKSIIRLLTDSKKKKDAVLSLQRLLISYNYKPSFRNLINNIILKLEKMSDKEYSELNYDDIIEAM